MAAIAQRLDLRKLRYFSEVVECRSMSGAAEELHVAQSALSKSIHALEQVLQTELLQRSAHGVTPTEAGNRLYEHCRIIFLQLDRACTEVRESGQKSSTQVTVGMPFSIASVLALPLLRGASKQFPQVRVELVHAHSHELPAHIRSGRVDFAVMARSRTPSALAVKALILEELFYVDYESGSTSPSKSPVSFDEAARRSYVLPPVGNGLRSAAEGYFRTHSLQLEVAQEIDEVALIPRCVEAGLGASILPGGYLQRDQYYKNFVVRPFEGGCDRVLALVHSVKGITSAAGALMSLLQQLTSELIAKSQWLGARQI